MTKIKEVPGKVIKETDRIVDQANSFQFTRVHVAIFAIAAVIALLTVLKVLGA